MPRNSQSFTMKALFLPSTQLRNTRKYKNLISAEKSKMADLFSKKIITNLSKYNLSDGEKQLLTRGLSFIPTTAHTPKTYTSQASTTSKKRFCDYSTSATTPRINTGIRSG